MAVIEHDYSKILSVNTFEMMEFSTLVRRWKSERSDSARKGCSLALTLEESFGCLQRHLSCNAYICGSSLLYLNGNLIVLVS